MPIFADMNPLPEQPVSSVDDVTALVQSATSPFIIRGLVADWPLVQAAAKSKQTAIDLLKRHDLGSSVAVSVLPAAEQGRVFYNESLTGPNFQMQRMPFIELMNHFSQMHFSQISGPSQEPTPSKGHSPTLYMGSTSIDGIIADFGKDHVAGIEALKPLVSLWMGHKTTVAAHYDLPDNIACVAMGQRRFTVFPPDQLANLYIGPIDLTPAGQSVSMVDFDRPDFDRFPNFKQAIRPA